ncbi:MAG: hypothetical protein ACR2GY_03070 [Phycisphaerales bacterium]
MLISAGLFAYAGWGLPWVHRYTLAQPPQLIPMIAVLMWTLRISAIGMGAAVVSAFILPPLSQLINVIVCAGAGIVFGIAALWEVMNKQGYTTGIPWFLLAVLSVWCLYSMLQSAVLLRHTIRTMHASRPPRGSDSSDDSNPFRRGL